MYLNPERGAVSPFRFFPAVTTIPYVLPTLLLTAHLSLGLLFAQDLHQKPHFEARKNLSEYNGPGRDEPEPEGLTSVRIGYFGPDEAGDPLHGDLWRAAQMALDELNRGGGYKGLPFELISGWSDNPWGSGVTQIARMVFQDGVWAIIGGVDGSSAHLAEQVAAKAFVPLLNPGSTDKTINLANVPWMFSCLPGEHIQAPLLTQALAGEIGPGGRFALVTGTDHDSRVYSSVLRRYWNQRGMAPAWHHEIGPSDAGIALLDDLPHETGAVVVLADPQQSRRIVDRLRMHIQAAIFGSPAFGRYGFLADAPERLGRVYFPYPASLQTGSFEARFLERYGHEPDFAARQTYDAVQLFGDALQSAGLNRARIRDALRAAAPWSGTAGVIDWDNLGQNQREVFLATIQDGRILLVPRHE